MIDLIEKFGKMTHALFSPSIYWGMNCCQGWVPLLPQKLCSWGGGGLQGLDGETCLVPGFRINSSVQPTGFSHVLLHDLSQSVG